MAAPGQRERFVVGLGCTALIGGLATMIWGRTATVGAVTMCGVATGMQLLVARMVARGGVSGSVDQVKRYAVGVAFRMIGVVIFAALVAMDRKDFSPAASALGYLGTVLPLMYLETRLSR